VEAVRQLAAYADRMSASGRLGQIEELVVRIGPLRTERNEHCSKL
jgi:hypothetical protein